MPVLSERVAQFTDSVIRRMTRISDAHGAINLSQGFPDFDPPKEMMDALGKGGLRGASSVFGHLRGAEFPRGAGEKTGTGHRKAH